MAEAWTVRQQAATNAGAGVRRFPTREVLIRTLIISAAAVAAVTAGVLISREHQDETPETDVPAGETAPAVQSLEAIRAAGL